jgi:hypothetical protein
VLISQLNTRSRHVLRYTTDVNRVATLTVNFTGYPLERFEKKVNLDRVTYYAAHLTFKLIVKGMNLVGEVWWYDQRMDQFIIKDIDQLSEE